MVSAFDQLIAHTMTYTLEGRNSAQSGVKQFRFESLNEAKKEVHRSGMHKCNSSISGCCLGVARSSIRTGCLSNLV